MAFSPARGVSEWAARADAGQTFLFEPAYGLDRKEKSYAYLFITMNKYSIGGKA